MKDRKNNNKFFILCVVVLVVGVLGFFRGLANPMALKFFAALGDADAQRHLGEINLYGNPKDYAEALRLFRLAEKKEIFGLRADWERCMQKAGVYNEILNRPKNYGVTALQKDLRELSITSGCYIKMAMA